VWIEQAVRRVFALQILRDFAAQEPARDGMGWIAAQASGAAVLNMDQEGTGVGAIERTDGVADLHISRITIKLHEITKRTQAAAFFRHNQTNPSAATLTPQPNEPKTILTAPACRASNP
jgi:hypothetical protein